MKWRGRPLTSHEVIVNTIAATTTRTGLTVSAEPGTGDYPKSVKISDREIKNLEKQNVPRRPRLPRRVELLPRPSPHLKPACYSFAGT